MSKKVPKPGRFSGRAWARSESASVAIQALDQAHLNEMRRVLARCPAEDRHGAFRFLEEQHLVYVSLSERPSPSLIARALVEWLGKKAA